MPAVDLRKKLVNIRTSIRGDITSTKALQTSLAANSLAKPNVTAMLALLRAADLSATQAIADILLISVPLSPISDVGDWGDALGTQRR